MSKLSVYFTTWSSRWTSDINSFDLNNLPKKYPGLTMVLISFCKPDLSYTKGQNTFSNTGLEFSHDFSLVRQAVSNLQKAGVSVILSVGGGAYWSGTKGVNAPALAALVSDLNLDGIDIDWEHNLAHDYELTQAIQIIRPIIPGKLLGFAGWSTGAFPPQGTYQGMCIHAMRNAGHLVDFINIMAYDAGPPSDYDPRKAIDAYASLYGGALYLGFLVGAPGWGGYILSMNDVVQNATFLKQKGSKHGAFLWSDNKQGTPSDVQVISKCREIFTSPASSPSLPNPSKPALPLPPSKTKTLLLKCGVCQTEYTI